MNTISFVSFFLFSVFTLFLTGVIHQGYICGGCGSGSGRGSTGPP